MRKPPQFENHPMSFPKSVEYRAYCHYVNDGDTIDVLVDLGLYEYSYKTIRIEGFDAPETRRYKDQVTIEEIEHGKAATEHLKTLILDKPVKLVTSDKVSLTRIVGRIYYWDENLHLWENISDRMIADGFEKKERPYYT
jgi:endonuclease YncB( thermonuclease family)